MVTAAIAIADARGIVMSHDKFMLLEYGGYVDLSLTWAQSLLRRMNFVNRKATTAKSKFNPAEFSKLKDDFLSELQAIVELEEIPCELILNWDQMGIYLVLSSLWTMDKKGSKRVEIVGTNDKRMITAVLCGSLTGDFLPVQLVYKGKTNRCHPRFKFLLDWNITHSPRHWSTEDTMKEYLLEIIVPYIEAQRDLINEPGKSAVVIIDNFKGQVTREVFQILEKHNIHTCLLPPNTTDRLQPMDVSVNKAAKSFLRKKFDNWYASQISDQLAGKDPTTVVLDPIDLSMPHLRELGARWLVEMAVWHAVRIKNNNVTTYTSYCTHALCPAGWVRD